MKLGKTVGTIFRAIGPNGDPIACDALPVATVIKNGVVTSVVCVVAAAADIGVYSVTLTLPSNWTDGDLVDLDIRTVIQGYEATALIRLGTINTATDVVAAQTSTLTSIAADVRDLQGLV